MTAVEIVIAILTAITAFFAGYEFWTLIIMWPVEVKVVKDRNVGEDFTVIVRNKTHMRISGGTRLCILPRNIKVNGKKLKFKSIPQRELSWSIRTGQPPKMVEEVQALYCESPAAIDPTTWRGLWATYLDPEGGDREKKISTAPFQIYLDRMKQIVEQIEDRTVESLRNDHTQEEARKIIETRKQKIMEEYKKEEGEIVDEIEDCVFPTIKLPYNASRIELELLGIGRFWFVKRKGDWYLEDKKKLS